ncbi:SHOCT domain-containing protein [Nitrosopumilus sp. S4]
MEIKSEKSIKEYLTKLPDDTIIKYYLDVEYSPFPVLLIEEYTRRFKRKTKSQLIKDLKFQAHLARKKTREIGNMARRKKFIDDVTKEKTDEMIHQAKKKGYVISEKLSRQSTAIGSKLKKKTKSGIKSSIKASQKLKTPTKAKLGLLEKLSELHKSGIITKKEFEEKKKKILSTI